MPENKNKGKKGACYEGFFCVPLIPQRKNVHTFHISKLQRYYYAQNKANAYLVARKGFANDKNVETLAALPT